MSTKQCVIRISEQALIGLVLSALESFATKSKNIKNGDKTKLETYGNLFGHHAELINGTPLFNIDFVHTDISAEQKRNQVSYNKEAIKLKVDTISSYWPQLEYLGDFHSHPDDHYTMIHESKNYCLSPGDREDLIRNTDFFKSLNYRIGLVVAISSLEKSGSRTTQYIGKNRSCIEFTFNNLRLWINAYSVFENNGKLHYSDDNSDGVILDIPSLNGLIFQHTEFGRYSQDIYQPSGSFS